MRSTSAPSPPRCEASDERRRPHPGADPAGHGAGAARRARPARGRPAGSRTAACASRIRPGRRGSSCCRRRSPTWRARGRPASTCIGRSRTRSPTSARRRRRARHDAGHARPLARARLSLGTTPDRRAVTGLGDRGERGDADRDPARAVDGVGGAPDAGTRADGARPGDLGWSATTTRRGTGSASTIRSTTARSGRWPTRVRLVRGSAARSAERSAIASLSDLHASPRPSSAGHCPASELDVATPFLAVVRGRLHRPERWPRWPPPAAAHPLITDGSWWPTGTLAHGAVVAASAGPTRLAGRRGRPARRGAGRSPGPATRFACLGADRDGRARRPHGRVPRRGRRASPRTQALREDRMLEAFQLGLLTRSTTPTAGRGSTPGCTRRLPGPGGQRTHARAGARRGPRTASCPGRGRHARGRCAHLARGRPRVAARGPTRPPPRPPPTSSGRSPAGSRQRLPSSCRACGAR